MLDNIVQAWVITDHLSGAPTYLDHLKKTSRNPDKTQNPDVTRWKRIYKRSSFLYCCRKSRAFFYSEKQHAWCILNATRGAVTDVFFCFVHHVVRSFIRIRTTQYMDWLLPGMNDNVDMFFWFVWFFSCIIFPITRTPGILPWSLRREYSSQINVACRVWRFLKYFTALLRGRVGMVWIWIV